MIDRRGFIGLMFGAAVAPKAVLDGLVTPAPVKSAMETISFTWIGIDKDVHEMMKDLQPNELMMLAVQVGFNGLGISDEQWSLRQGPLEMKGDFA